MNNGGLSLKNKVELDDGSKIQINYLRIGDYIKTANDNFCHIFQNKLSCFKDSKNVTFSKISKIQFLDASFKSIVKLITENNKTIFSTSDYEYTVMRLEDGLNNYYKKPLYDILDSYQPNNFEYIGTPYMIVTEDGIQKIRKFEFINQSNLIVANIETVDCNRIFVEGILL